MHEWQLAVSKRFVSRSRSSQQGPSDFLDIEKTKTLRLKKLLAAADKRLKQAESDLDVRGAEIAALKYRLSLNS